MSKPNQIEVIASDSNRCGEGPIWDAEKQRLLWTDIESALVYEFTEPERRSPDRRGGAAIKPADLEIGAPHAGPYEENKQIISRGLTVSGIGLNRTGELIFCGAGGLHLWRGQDDFRTVVSLHENVKLSLNDMSVDPQGRVYAGMLHWGANGLEKLGTLYLINCDGSVRIVDEGIELSNGLGFSPDNRTLFFSDSSARQIYAYDVNPTTGDLSNKRSFVQVPNEEGIPDGLTVDAEGFVWSAQWFGSQVVRYDPSGKVERRVKFPVTQISSVAFGGKDLNELYVTSAADGWGNSPCFPTGFDAKAGNWGGDLYRVKTDIQGRVEYKASFVGDAVTSL